MSDQPVSVVVLPVLDSDGREAAALRLSCRPEQTKWNQLDVLLNRRGDPELDGASPIQLLEDIEYRYIVAGGEGDVSLEPVELFDADNRSGRSGRLRPLRYTGTISVGLSRADGSAIGRCEFEVRSRKLNYLNEYRWMLGRIADEATEALMHRFSASEVRLSPTRAGTPQTLYQRFALLKALLESDGVDSSLSLVTNRPHTEYRTEIERTDPARGLRPGRQTMQALVGPGPRMPSNMLNLRTVPREVDRVIHTETVDTVPNRLVKHALEEWLGLVIDVRSALGKAATHTEQRGLREARALEDQIVAHLNTPLFNDVGVLTSFPAGNQVLQRREGYRDIFRVFLMMDVAAALEWSGGEDVFKAGQRNVATLYEYWVFLELARIIAVVTGQPLDNTNLFQLEKGQLSLNLRRDSKAVLRGSVERRGRRLDLGLYFNRQFGHGKHGSWTTSVRPDCSLRVSVHGDAATSTWLHFDAKYRLHELKEVLMEPISDAEEDEPVTTTSSTVKNDDLLKMHAYRDAVRRTSGAYVLYPGSDDRPENPLRKYHEVLPGLGAFVLRPTEAGHASKAGVDAVSRFIDDVIDHIAAQGTSRERARYWEGESYQSWAEQSDAAERRLDPVSFLEMPPDDTVVLLGLVKDDGHHAWILENMLYNLRGDADRAGAIGIDSPELRASLLLLYHPDWEEAELFRLSGAMYLQSEDDLVASGYSDPMGDRYLCLGIEAALVVEGIDAGRVAAVARQERARSDWAAPLAVRWADLQAALREGR